MFHRMTVNFLFLITLAIPSLPLSAADNAPQTRNPWQRGSMNREFRTAAPFPGTSAPWGTDSFSPFREAPGINRNRTEPNYPGTAYPPAYRANPNPFPQSPYTQSGQAVEPGIGEPSPTPPALPGKMPNNPNMQVLPSAAQKYLPNYPSPANDAAMPSARDESLNFGNGFQSPPPAAPYPPNYAFPAPPSATPQQFMNNPSYQYQDASRPYPQASPRFPAVDPVFRDSRGKPNVPAEDFNSYNSRSRRAFTESQQTAPNTFQTAPANRSLTPPYPPPAKTPEPLPGMPNNQH